MQGEGDMRHNEWLEPQSITGLGCGGSSAHERTTGYTSGAYPYRKYRSTAGPENNPGGWQSSAISYM